MNKEELTPIKIIESIKNSRSTPTPNAAELLKDLDFTKHSVFDPEIRKKVRVQVETEERDTDGKITKPAKFETQDVNRIGLPLEQDIVNVHTAFTVGMPPKLICHNSEEKGVDSIMTILNRIFRSNKIKFINKRVVRSWLSECEVAEYWYAVDDVSFGRKMLNKILSTAGISVIPTKKLKVDIWSPFRGDTLYPVKDNQKNLIGFGREYEIKDSQGRNITRFMYIDDKNVTIYTTGENGFELAKPEDVGLKQNPQLHGFPKMPIVFMERKEPYCKKIKSIRERLETLLSNFADCIDYNFFPKLVLKGDVDKFYAGTNGRGSQVKLDGDDASAGYLTWNQAPDSVKLEIATLLEQAYALTNTPRISFENLSGLGNSFSGVSFEFSFMGIRLAVSNHAEDVEEYLQRRVNFLISAIGYLYPAMRDTSEIADIETEVVPYTIRNRSDDINDASKAVSSGVASRKTGIILAGLVDNVVEEEEFIKAETDQQDVSKPQ